jgi:PAS domain S-box-containing protein
MGVFDEASHRALEQLRYQALRRLALVRFVGATGFLIVAAAWGYGKDLADWRVYVGPLALYAALAGALAAIVRAQRFRGLAVFAVPLIDVPAVYALQATSLPLSPFPAGVAGWSLGLFALLVVLGALSFRSQAIYLTVLTASVAEGSLQRMADVGWGAVTCSAIVLTLIAAITHWADKQLEGYVHQMVGQQAELHHQAALYANLLNGQSALDDGVALADAERITYANDALARICGYSIDELKSLPSFKELLPASEREKVQKNLESRIRNPDAPLERVESVVVRKDGTQVVIEYSVKPLSLDGRLQLFAIVRDITARKKAENDLAAAHRQIIEEQYKLIQAEKLASIGLLAAGVAHEINNPLTGVQHCLRLARAPNTSEEKRAHYFGAVDGALKRIATTVRSLLDYATPRGEVPFGPVDVQQMIWRCVPLLEPALKTNGVTLNVQMAAGQTLVFGDESQLAQAAINILLNAIHASSAHNVVTVSAEQQENRVGVKFVDRGAGIPPEVLSRVREPFFTTKPHGKGTGLGLAVTQQIVDHHRGTMTIESEPGKGTEVVLWLNKAS